MCRILKSNTGSGGIVLPTGTERLAGIGFSTRIVKAPGEVNLPARPVEVKLQAKFQLGSRVTQEDSFQFTILPKPTVPRSEKPLYLFDPQGQTTRLLKKLDITKIPFAPTSDLSKSDTLIVGKNALTIDGPAPPIDRVRDGLKVIMFEQQPEVLEKRLGFRVQQYGLRQVFPRVPDHLALAGLSQETLRDWRGESTLLPPQLKYEMWPTHGPKITWCDIPVTQAWRCGNQGNVASALIEKPACGDFLPIVDGGFSLQYAR